jgi:hypothetical protein
MLGQNLKNDEIIGEKNYELDFSLNLDCKLNDTEHFQMWDWKKNWNKIKGEMKKKGAELKILRTKQTSHDDPLVFYLQDKSKNNVHYLSRDGFKTISCSIWWAWSHIEQHVLTNLFHCVSRQSNIWLQCSFLVYTKFETTIKLSACYKNNQLTLLGEKYLINMFLFHKMKIINSFLR